VPMITYTLFVIDDRYTIPNVALVAAADRRAIVAAARTRLMETPHHIAIEIFEDETMLAWLDREDIVWSAQAG
jgi:hypothetical protein